ncbi:MAG TPA: LEA type 2 family protein [Gemmatimonadaceae bacterium]|nr:LEA type 2 family protein [Gemmatimonadaceae bacterium]
MNARTIRKLVLAAVAVAALGACATLGRQLFRQPAVTLRDVRLVGLGVTGGNLDVVLGVYNPNGYRLDATSLHYHLMVDTVEVADGEITDRQAFQGGDTTIVHLPVRFSYAGVGAAGRELTQTGAVNYKVLGDITVDSPVGTRSFPFTSTGRFTTVDAKIH